MYIKPEIEEIKFATESVAASTEEFSTNSGRG